MSPREQPLEVVARAVEVQNQTAQYISNIIQRRAEIIRDTANQSDPYIQGQREALRWALDTIRSLFGVA